VGSSPGTSSKECFKLRIRRNARTVRARSGKERGEAVGVNYADRRERGGEEGARA